MKILNIEADNTDDNAKKVVWSCVCCYSDGVCVMTGGGGGQVAKLSCWARQWLVSLVTTAHCTATPHLVPHTYTDTEIYGLLELQTEIREDWSF